MIDSKSAQLCRCAPKCRVRATTMESVDSELSEEGLLLLGAIVKCISRAWLEHLYIYNMSNSEIFCCPAHHPNHALSRQVMYTFIVQHNLQFPFELHVCSTTISRAEMPPTIPPGRTPIPAVNFLHSERISRCYRSLR